MSSVGYIRKANHPYGWQKQYKHFRETVFQHRPYSAAPIPFGWMLRGADGSPPPQVQQYDLGFDENYEPELENFTSRWVQERRNQLTMLDTFFGAIKPQESLAFFYAKRTPLSEDPRRVLIGLGRVTDAEKHVEYSYAEDAPKDALRCVLWERNLHHSIRANGTDGFLLPYRDLLERAEADPAFDPSAYTLHIPEEHWSAFSMGAEHVTHDQAVSVLVAASRLLARLKSVVPGSWDRATEWIDAQLNRAWSLRGAFPGLGSALSACGIPNGTLVAYAVGELMAKYDPNGDPWAVVDKVIEKPALLPDDLAKSLGKNTAKLWDSLKGTKRRDLLQLLARFELSETQARRWYHSERAARFGIDLKDGQILENPYVLYEHDRMSAEPVSFGLVDRGLFADKKVLADHPIPAPSACPEPLDIRRGRALCIETLERAAVTDGHTLLPQHWLIQRISEADVQPPCAVSTDWLMAFKGDLDAEIKQCSLKDEAPAWQLRRYEAMRNVIASQVQKRVKGKPHGGDHKWRALIDSHLAGIDTASDPEREERARKEKAKALEVVYRHRFAVLIGPAGTGKTTLLSALLTIPSIRVGGVLLLAPTGKARVQMQKHAGKAEARTLAQFLLAYKRYDAETQRYCVTFDPTREKAFKTVIIDECSMLTEDQLAATFDALSPEAVERVIMVGDPQQLPPIGAGRPFVDIIRYLQKAVDEKKGVPAPGFAELKVLCRQSGGATALDDIAVARWFGWDAPDPGADEVWDRLKSGHTSRIEIVEWETPADLQEKVINCVTQEVKRIAEKRGHAGRTDEENLEISFGGKPYEHGGVFFIPTRLNGGNVEEEGAGPQAERWQILSPIRASEAGVESLNRRIQKDFRKRALRVAVPELPWLRKTAKPLGPQGILYGDKVINVANSSRRDVWPEKKSYVANGEIGIVVGQYKGGKIQKPWKHEVEFSTQPGFKYSYGTGDFGEDGDAPLELGYALTIHKAQGSEFETTFVIVPNPCRLLSRELLYTALTRQKRRIVLFHQGDVRGLINLSDVSHSETARRLTNLFSSAAPFEHGGRFLEGALVHRSSKGKLVRSKSEVIVADILERLGISYEYELRFDGADGKFRSPDFTIQDALSGRTVIIEHLGMLDDPEYKQRWEKKKAWYRANGVLPHEEGGGERATLVTTSEIGGIDEPKIEELFKAIFAR
ncbi:MAG: AAA family ATPase [Rhodospirillaceae bacterium]|nr:AAA family ATPase [Rhodospirillaceae bacterium]